MISYVISTLSHPRVDHTERSINPPLLYSLSGTVNCSLLITATHMHSFIQYNMCKAIKGGRLHRGSYMWGEVSPVLLRAWQLKLCIRVHDRGGTEDIISDTYLLLLGSMRNITLLIHPRAPESCTAPIQLLPCDSQCEEETCITARSIFPFPKISLLKKHNPPVSAADQGSYCESIVGGRIAASFSVHMTNLTQILRQECVLM